MADSIVIGSGPNGLACGIRLAKEGCSVTIYE
ncbi:NAD(P)-binding protein [Fodinibius halophilus]|uniref:NAD(P)-binding protein n=1 Tax=Fodinibius halophilus TaxID=1736908 RepID=A0A6M1THE8_9BACT|nr:NAD(P)-binding protein [Fodinibius halophilus]NGP88060.1 NAD(P)-binding protein [Fodinibius halophilus]